MSQKKQVGDIPNMEWLSTLEEKGSRYCQVSERIFYLFTYRAFIQMIGFYFICTQTH